MKPPYKTSKDYNKLWELAKQGYMIVCFLYSYEVNNYSWVCSTFTYENIEIGTNDYVYINSKSKKDFIEQCKKYKVEFIEPLNECKDCKFYLTDNEWQQCFNKIDNDPEVIGIDPDYECFKCSNFYANQFQEKDK